jgi:hypothetical protein
MPRSAANFNGSQAHLDNGCCSLWEHRWLDPGVHGLEQSSSETFSSQEKAFHMSSVFHILELAMGGVWITSDMPLRYFFLATLQWFHLVNGSNVSRNYAFLSPQLYIGFYNYTTWFSSIFSLILSPILTINMNKSIQKQL